LKLKRKLIVIVSNNNEMLTEIKKSAVRLSDCWTVS